MALALAMASSRFMAQALSPLTVISQAIPFIALAPLMMVWLGFGLSSKVGDGGDHDLLHRLRCLLRGSAPGRREPHRSGAPLRASDWQICSRSAFPAALPHLAAGLKLAAAYAPLGAIAGEWVGSEGGLGIMMTYHNARMQTDMVFMRRWWF